MNTRLLSFCAAVGGILAASAAACSVSSGVEDLFSPNAPEGNGGSGGGQGGAPSTSSTTASSASTSSSTTTASSGGGAGGGSVNCNTVPCAPGEVCCFRNASPSQSACAAPGNCPGSAIELACNGPDDCPGEVCCGDWIPSAQTYSGLSCQPTCQGPTHLLQCDGDESVCPPGTTCYPSGILGAGYSYCQ